MKLFKRLTVSPQLFLALGLSCASLLPASAQVLEKLQPVSSTGSKFTYDISLPAPDHVQNIQVAVDGKPLAENGNLDFTTIDDVNNDYTCDVLFLVDKGAGGGQTTAQNDAAAFQTTLKRLVDKTVAKNSNRDAIRKQNAKQDSSAAPTKSSLYSVEIATIEGAAYQKLASADSDKAKLNEAINTISLDTGSQTIANGLSNVVAEFQTMPGDRKYIVLVSSGRFSDHSTSLDDVIRDAKNSGVKICTIGFNDGHDDDGLNLMSNLSHETKGFSITSDRVASDGTFGLAEEKLDDLLAYMVSGAKGTVDLSAAHLPGTLRFTVDTTFGKTYVVNQKVDALPTATATTTTPASTNAPTATAPSTNGAPVASTNAPSTNSPTAGTTNAAPVIAGSTTAATPAKGDSMAWIKDEYKKEPAKVIGVLVAALILLGILIGVIIRMTKQAPQGNIVLPASPASTYAPPGVSNDAPTQVPGYTPNDGATSIVSNPTTSTTTSVSSDAPVLGYLENLGDSSRFPIRSKSIRIGRKADNDLVISNDSISNYHAEIIKRDGKFVILDRGSSNKVYIAGRPVHNVPLNDGDVIELGDIRLRFQNNS